MIRLTNHSWKWLLLCTFPLQNMQHLKFVNNNYVKKSYTVNFDESCSIYKVIVINNLEFLNSQAAYCYVKYSFFNTVIRPFCFISLYLKVVTCSLKEIKKKSFPFFLRWSVSYSFIAKQVYFLSLSLSFVLLFISFTYLQLRQKAMLIIYKYIHT